ncbi:hypothetical protein NM208_g2690 [Fusarium decemcellulare]|uniref:Uncharacterized protein n=1 Tax=Fusarium decemcellulare TaxID=57161 RepID=A0ACC1SRS9_9HYPO|nr:hypothetical protein NM208_g2690 [Fusarium decemcellulare]
MTISYSDKSSGEETDLGTLWQEALIKYCEECGTDLRTLPISRLNLTHIKAEQEHQLVLFSEYRHDKGKLDKLRSLVASNSDIVVGVATHIANAGSAAFPPSAALLTAFNYVMNASRAVSEDYDMIVSFFDVMNSFLERISMLESRMPGEWQFRRFLVNVFSAMMTLSAIARKCRLKGRLSRWAKALIDGSDPKLKGAFDSLHMHLGRFESAAMLTTLKHTLESGKKLDSLGRGMKEIQLSVEKAHLLSQQGYALGLESKSHAKDAASTSHEILTVVSRQEEQGADHTAGLHQVMKTLNKMSSTKGSQEKLVDAGSRKSISMRTLETLLDYNLDDETDFTSIESHYIDRTYSWFRTQDVYSDFEIGKVRLLWLLGPAGMGKSTLAYTIVKALQEELISNTTTTVAHFFFRGDSNRRFVSQMLRSCALQVAVRNNAYREETVADIQIYQKRPRGRLNNSCLSQDHEKLWELLFQTKFTKKSGRRLVLILDGVDETDEEDRKYIGMILGDISSSEQINIQVLFVSGPGSFIPAPEAKVRIFEMTKELILPDIRSIIVARLRSLSRMRKLSQQAKRKIITRLSKQADTMRYIDHMLRTLDQLGRSETAVVRQLNNLPSCTTELYQIMLEECQKSRTDSEFVILKKFFAWLAYTTEPLYLGCARKLLNYIATDNTINIDEELENRCARILRLSNTILDYDEEDYDDSDANTDHSGDEYPADNDDDGFVDFSVTVSFQENGLRSYFRPPGNLVGDRLRTSASSGHAMILQIIQSILCTGPVIQVDYGERALHADAVTGWTHHLQAINQAELSEEEAACVIESICNILSNRGGSIQKMEFYRRRWGRTGPPCVLGKTDEDIEKILACLQAWAVSATKMSPSRISNATATWMRPLARNPHAVFINLAEAHVTNWLMSHGHMDDRDINNRYLFAHYALYRGRHLADVQQNQQLRAYFMEHAERGDISSGLAIETSFIVVSRAFLHIDMTAQSYLSVAVSMLYNGLKESCLEQLDLAIRQADTDIERMEIYMRMAHVHIMLTGPTRPNIDDAGLGGVGTDEIKSKGGSDAGDDKVEKSPAPKYDQLTREALRVVAKAAKIASSLSASAMKDSKVQNIAHAVWMFKAKAEIMAGDTSNTVAYCKRAIQICPADSGLRRFEILPSLAEARSWRTFLDAIKVLSRVSWLSGCICLEDYMHEMHSAAKATGETEFILELYRNTVPAAQFNGANESRLMVNWARFYRDVVGTLDAISKAKTLLNKVIDTKGSTHYSAASFLLADILLEEFRGTTQLKKKVMAYNEMRDVVKRVSESMGSEFDASQSQTVIPLAHMTRKMDSVEFQQGLERTFEGCVAALTDEAGWNDTLSLRVLARVLAVVGLEREAQIVATCQIYILDMEIFKRENDSRITGPGGSDGGEETERRGGSDGKDDGEIEINDLPANSPVAPASSECNKGEDQSKYGNEVSGADKQFAGLDDADGDLNWDSGTVTCSDCERLIRQWSKTHVYLCYYCTEVDLCQECFDKRTERIAGKRSDDWRVICPQGHRHIQMPVQGWKGLTGGVMKIADTEVPFRDWLLDVKEKKWPNTWERFWSSE